MTRAWCKARDFCNEGGTFRHEDGTVKDVTDLEEIPNWCPLKDYIEPDPEVSSVGGGSDDNT